MKEVIRFIPKHDLSAQQNLENFISLARGLTLWSELPGFFWEADKWPTTHCTARFVNFESRDLHPKKLPEPQQLMHPEFIETAKAYLRYKHTLRPNKVLLHELRALRVIEFVLRQDMATPHITAFEQRHWESAVSYLASVPSRQTLCVVMLEILKTLASLCIIKADPRFWKHPYVGRHSYEALNGSRAPDQARSKKAPDQSALLAIAEIFSHGNSQKQEDTDIMITCTTGLLMCAPMRIGEVLRFRTDCLHDDYDKNGERQHYLAYWVPKTREFARKPIPKTFFKTVTDSFERLKSITEEARRLALYMETNPTRFYRHANCPTVPDDQELRPDQVVQALGFSSQGSCESFVRRHTGRYALTGFTLNSLWSLVLNEHRLLNPHFPYQEPPESSTQLPLKMSESLFCFFRFQLATRSGSSPVLLAPFDSGYYSGRFKRGNEKAISMNFFARHGYELTKFKSHSLRHLLNRLGRSSGISVEMLTEWSSRASCTQTRTYLHDDTAKAAAKGAAALGTTQEQEPKNPITQDESEAYRQGPFHRSRYGICCRSWRAGPCNKFADCLNCSELLICKGDRVAAEIIATDRNNLVQTYTAAQQAIANGERSASRWTEKAGPQIERLDQLLSILNNPQIPDGSPIQIAGEDFSHERVIVSEKAKAAGVQLLDRKALGLTYGEELLACLDLLRDPNDA